MIGPRLFCSGVFAGIMFLAFGALVRDKSKPQTGFMAFFGLAFLLLGLVVLVGGLMCIWEAIL